MTTTQDTTTNKQTATYSLDRMPGTDGEDGMFQLFRNGLPIMTDVEWACQDAWSQYRSADETGVAMIICRKDERGDTVFELDHARTEEQARRFARKEVKWESTIWVHTAGEFFEGTLGKETNESLRGRGIIGNTLEPLEGLPGFDDALDQYWEEIREQVLEGYEGETVLAEKIAKDAGVQLSQEVADATVDGWIAELENLTPEQKAANGDKIILSLFDRTGTWAEPFLAAGFDVRCIDIEIDGEDLGDVLKINTEFLQDFELEMVHGVLAACPCTHFAGSGARHWKAKDADGRTAQGVELVLQTLAIIEYLAPEFWVIENPVGRIGKLTGIGKPLLQFQPHNYGDPHTKRTQLWGRFNPHLPQANVHPSEGSIVVKVWSDDFARSATPRGFAAAFALANAFHSPARRVGEILNEKGGE